jgi:hypothetical protein
MAGPTRQLGHRPNQAITSQPIWWEARTARLAIPALPAGRPRKWTTTIS